MALSYFIFLEFIVSLLPFANFGGLSQAFLQHNCVHLKNDTHVGEDLGKTV